MEAEKLSYEDAVKLLPEGDTVHTFRSNGMMLLGADWKREELLALMKASPFINRTIGTARAMKHGLCINAHGPLFIETVEE